MKWMNFVFALLLPVAASKKNIVRSLKKSDIIKRSEEHAKDLINLDHKAVMTFYGKADDLVVFRDGYYWGNYITIDQI